MTDSKPKTGQQLSEAAALFGKNKEEITEFSRIAFEHNVTLSVMKVLGYDSAAIAQVVERSGLDGNLVSWDSFISIFEPFSFRVQIMSLPKKDKFINLASLLVDFPKSKLYKIWRKSYNEMNDFVILDANGFASSGGLVIGWVSEKPLLHTRSGSVLLGTAALRPDDNGRVDLDHCIIGTLRNVFEYLLDSGAVHQFDRCAVAP
jgi:hypothetical protein